MSEICKESSAPGLETYPLDLSIAPSLEWRGQGATLSVKLMLMHEVDKSAL